jgi:hypothetical protein
VSPHVIPETIGVLRARIEVLEQLLRQVHPESQEAFRIHQKLAQMGRQVAVKEGRSAEIKL